MPERPSYPYQTKITRRKETIPDVQLSVEEVEEAKRSGVYKPNAGVPDEKAIADIFGITREDLFPIDSKRQPYRGKRTPGGYPTGRERGILIDQGGRPRSNAF